VTSLRDLHIAASPDSVGEALIMTLRDHLGATLELQDGRR
jgi:hypothetical protein